MKKTYTAEEVTQIENQAYETGLAVGKYFEKQRIINLMEDMNDCTKTHLGSLVWTKNLIEQIERNV